MLGASVLLAQGPAEPAKGPPAGLDSTFLLMTIGLSFIFFIFLPMRRDARVRRELLRALKKNDRVLLNGFLIGTVVQIIAANQPRGEDELLVKIDENANIKMRVLRSAVTRIFPSDEPTKETKEGT